MGASNIVYTLQRIYKERLVIAVAQSAQRTQLVAQGQGLEPRLQFSTSEIELDPVLPYSNGQEVEVLVHNPCPFSIEFYSVDFDRQYLEEEMVTVLYTIFEQQVWLGIKKNQFTFKALYQKFLRMKKMVLSTGLS